MDAVLLRVTMCASAEGMNGGQRGDVEGRVRRVLLSSDAANESERKEIITPSACVSPKGRVRMRTATADGKDECGSREILRFITHWSEWMVFVIGHPSAFPDSARSGI